MIENLTKEDTSISHTPSELPVLGFDAIEFYVGNAKLTAHFYNALFGFDIIAYRGPENGNREVSSYILRQNDLQFIISAGLKPYHPVVEQVHKHGDGVKDIGFKVQDVHKAFQMAIERGAKPVLSPTVLEDEFGTVTKATIATYGETTHTFANRDNYRGVFEPGYVEHFVAGKTTGIERVDHVVGNVEAGRMNDWVSFYERVFGFYVLRHYDENDISTQFSALVSKVMANRSGTIKLPINEPAKGLKKSQIQEYLDFYRTPGVQHMALATQDIISTVQALRDRGVELMTVPDRYYENLAERVGPIQEPILELAKLGILVDREDEGYLLQIFTQPMEDIPTFFFEIIQRQGAEGFGKGNFKALFEAIERDQDRRGNL